MRVIWLGLGLISLALGVVGLFLPLLPTVPFLLLAAFLFARSSERLHGWLLAHPWFGPQISDWNQRGAIGRRAKWLASASIAASFGLALALGFGVVVLSVQAATLCVVALFIWTRPDG